MVGVPCCSEDDVRGSVVVEEDGTDEDAKDVVCEGMDDVDVDV